MLEPFRDELAQPLTVERLPTADWAYVRAGEYTRISGNIDGLDAYAKDVWKTFMTPRFMFPDMYPDWHGSEFHLGLNRGEGYMRARFPQWTADALATDDRYISHEITSFEIRIKTVYATVRVVGVPGVYDLNFQTEI